MPLTDIEAIFRALAHSRFIKPPSSIESPLCAKANTEMIATTGGESKNFPSEPPRGIEVAGEGSVRDRLY
jgi:hypothetical protein